MKSSSFLLLFCGIGFLCGHYFWPKAARYEFHPETGLFKGFVFRCDRQTGEVVRLLPAEASPASIIYVTNTVPAPDFLEDLDGVDRSIAWCNSNPNGGVIMEGTNGTNGEMVVSQRDLTRLKTVLYQERARIVRLINTETNIPDWAK